MADNQKLLVSPTFENDVWMSEKAKNRPSRKRVLVSAFFILAVTAVTCVWNRDDSPGEDVVRVEPVKRNMRTVKKAGNFFEALNDGSILGGKLR